MNCGQADADLANSSEKASSICFEEAKATVTVPAAEMKEEDQQQEEAEEREREVSAPRRRWLPTAR